CARAPGNYFDFW
nr:immunoglobulin heavy chain junction region [Mus musculus]MBK4187459.1 immunoglobulin heavy chain junction region [Mus musculus]